LESLHVLLLGTADVAQIEAALRSGGYAPVCRHVQTVEAARHALDTERWDVVLLDRPPTPLNVREALTFVQQRAPGVPLIIVSAAIPGAEAMAAMRAGAADYLAAGDLGRLAPVVARELCAVAERRARQEAEEALQRSEARADALLAKSFDGVVLLDADGRARFVSASVYHILGYGAGELLGTSARDVVHPADLARAGATLADVLRRPGGDARIVYRLRHKDGSVRWVEALVTNLLAEPSVDALVLNLRDISERMRAQEVRDRLAAIVETTADAIIGLSVRDTVETWNAAATDLFGYGPEEAIGRHIAFLAPAGVDQEQQAMLEAARGGMRRVDYETMRRHKDGHLLDVAVTLSPIGGTDGAVVGVSVIARDNAARRRSFEALERARAVAESLAERQRTFVAATSHELRTPLTVMVGFGELLLDRWGDLDERRRLDHLQKMIAAARRQQRLVEDLLLANQLDGGAFSVTPATVAMREIVGRALDEVAIMHPEQAICTTGPPDLAVRADAERAVQIVANLLDNAVKYSPEGSAIDAWWQAEGQVAVLRVRNRGAGVPVQHRERLFTRFGKIPGSPIRAGRVGTGLGLFVSRELARAMGGDLELESTGEEGSVFRLTLPLAASAI
jgi:PAS domain S-box-containing protein